MRAAAVEETRADQPVRLGSFGEPPCAVVLRPIDAVDEPFLRDLYATTREEELRLALWSEEQRRAFCDSQFSAQDLYYRQSHPHARFDVVEMASRRAGRLLVSFRGDAWEVLDISIVRELRDRGIGEFVLQWLQHRAAEAGVPIVLFVEPESRAERLYERLGFRVRTRSEFHQEMIWTPVACGRTALERFLDAALSDDALRSALSLADDDPGLVARAVSLGLAMGLAFTPDDVVEVIRERRRSWIERDVR